MSLTRELTDDGWCFACGALNPHGLQMKVAYAEDQGRQLARCELVLSRRFQGWNGIAHGGVVATVLDELMAHAVIHFVGQAVTTRFEIRYRKPVALGVELEAMGWVEQVRRRLVKAAAEIRTTHEPAPLAQASAEFFLTGGPKR